MKTRLRAIIFFSVCVTHFHLTFFQFFYQLIFKFYVLHIFGPTILILGRFSTITLLHLLLLFFFFFSCLTSESDSLCLLLENKLGNFTFCCEHVLLCKVAFCFIQLLMFALCICHATGVEEDPTVTQNIRCLWRGGGVALIQIK